jgi:hypothetical protein
MAAALSLEAAYAIRNIEVTKGKLVVAQELHGDLCLDAHQNRPTSAQKDGPSKCAGWSTARNLVGLECSLRRTTSDESRGAWQRILSPLLWFDPAGGLLPSRPQNISSRRAQQSSRTAGTPTERLARRFQAAP